MVTQTQTEYSAFLFEGNEEKVAQTFNQLQKMFLQNLRYESVQERDRLIPDFKCPEDYFYRKAQLDGQIAVLTYLIDLEVTDINDSSEV